MVQRDLEDVKILLGSRAGIRTIFSPVFCDLSVCLNGNPDLVLPSLDGRLCAMHLPWPPFA